VLDVRRLSLRAGLLIAEASLSVGQDILARRVDAVFSSSDRRDSPGRALAVIQDGSDTFDSNLAEVIHLQRDGQPVSGLRVLSGRTRLSFVRATNPPAVR
jgi:hypothetical protein